MVGWEAKKIGRKPRERLEKRGLESRPYSPLLFFRRGRLLSSCFCSARPSFQTDACCDHVRMYHIYFYVPGCVCMYVCISLCRPSALYFSSLSLHPMETNHIYLGVASETDTAHQHHHIRSAVVTLEICLVSKNTSQRPSRILSWVAPNRSLWMSKEGSNVGTTVVVVVGARSQEIRWLFK